MNRSKIVLLAFVSLVACKSKSTDSTAASRTAVGAQAAVTSQVCVGNDHACFLQPSGSVYCSGSNVDGELGDGTARDRFTHVPVVGIADATQLSCGSAHTCVRRRNGQVSCWGRNHHGELGSGTDASTLVPVTVAGVNDAAEVAAGRDFTCIRRTNGTVACWGSGENGRLGSGATENSMRPITVTGVTGAVEVVAGRAHACVRASSGAAWCWGANQSGQLGRGAGLHTDASSAAPVVTLTGSTDLAAGGNNTCAIVTGGALRCWGGNYQGQIGNRQAGDDAKEEAPTDVPGIAGAIAVAVSENRVCAALTGGVVKCWGYNNYTAGLLGTGSRDPSVPAPAQVFGIANAASLANGYQATCALTTARALVCWGANAHGLQGSGTRLSAHEGRAIIPDVAEFTSAPSVPETFAPTTAARGVVSQLALDQSHACGVSQDGKVHCFGNGTDGRLGNGSTRPIPAAEFASTVVGLTDVVQLASRGSRSCAVRANGKLACWGEFASGERSSLPVSMVGVDDAVEVALGYGFACVRHTDGGVSCWGQNNAGQLASGTRTTRDTPVRIEGVIGATHIALAGSSACAVVANGALACWGSNSHGELGTGSAETSSATVVTPRGLSGVTDLAADTTTFCAVSAGSVYCWGENDDGQVGNGDASRERNVRTPFKVATIRGASRITVGGGTTCAVLSSGEALCWGANDFGQTGHDDAEVDDVVSPTAVLRTADAAVAAFGPYAFMTCASTWCCGVHRDGHQSCAGSSPLGGSSGVLGLSDIRSQHPVEAPGVVWPTTASR